MSDKIEITCPRCKYQWKQSLQELEKLETLYKAADANAKPGVEIYRARCPNDGTYVIIEVAEEKKHG